MVKTDNPPIIENVIPPLLVKKKIAFAKKQKTG
jgi:hypothetical protein